MLLIFDLDDTLFARLPDNYTDEQVQAIRPHAGVVELLQRKDIFKVLVTKGDPLLQEQKLRVLGIRPLFDAVFICRSDEEKKNMFTRARNRFPIKQIWVIGDRIDSEIRWGNELGFKTVRLRQGKYRSQQPKGPKEKATFEICSIQELPKVIGLA